MTDDERKVVIQARDSLRQLIKEFVANTDETYADESPFTNPDIRRIIERYTYRLRVLSMILRGGRGISNDSLELWFAPHNHFESREDMKLYD